MNLGEAVTLVNTQIACGCHGAPPDGDPRCYCRRAYDEAHNLIRAAHIVARQLTDRETHMPDQHNYRLYPHQPHMSNTCDGCIAIAIVHTTTDVHDYVSRMLAFPCCQHCGCGTPDGEWDEPLGHDDTCAHGCNDNQLAGLVGLGAYWTQHEPQRLRG